MARRAEEEELASTVKKLHAKLRKLVRKGGDADTIWRDHLCDKSGLLEYSDAMRSLATGPWHQAQDQGGNRIAWCVDVCEEYFKRGAMIKLLLKDLRRTLHQMTTLVTLEVLPPTEEAVTHLAETFNSKRWRLLDVGSCYNPFKAFPQFEVTAVDIAPADKSVQWCDFMNVNIVEDNIPKENQANPSPPTITSIKHSSFDVVVFSLLLSYLPLPQQRLKCVVNAHKILKIHGLLLIITPDSSHQNKHTAMMKSWKSAIEAVGFHRWKYVKETHLHCLAFRKITPTTDYSKHLDSFQYMMYIPQDAHKDEDIDEQTEGGSLHSEIENVETFHELPFES